MYDCFKDEKGRLWIGIMGLKKRKRIKLLMISNVESEKALRIVLKGKKMEIHQAEDIDTKTNDNEEIVGIDK
jgi:hypothetical protein